MRVRAALLLLAMVAIAGVAAQDGASATATPAAQDDASATAAPAATPGPAALEKLDDAVDKTRAGLNKAANFVRLGDWAREDGRASAVARV
jgi:hypothetical protein